jgi:hypothetical protein
LTIEIISSTFTQMKKPSKKQLAQQPMTRQVVPYDTGKVQIGLRYIPPPPKMDDFDEQIQEGLLGVRSWKHTFLRGVLLYCGMVIAITGFLLLWTVARGAMNHA